MDINNLQALIANGLIVDMTDIDPNKAYVQIGVFQPGNRQSGAGNANAYKAYAISVTDLAGTAGMTTAQNGLTVLGGTTVELGGNLIHTTDININGYSVQFSNGVYPILFLDPGKQQAAIGGNNPNGMLDITAVGSGTVGLQLNTASTQDAKLHFRTNNAATARSQIYVEDATQTLNVYTVNSDTIFWNGNSLAQVKTLSLLTNNNAWFNGNVGIGTNNPITNLHVDGGSNPNTQIYLKSTGVDNGIQIDSGAYPFFYLKSSGVTNLGIQGVGSSLVAFRPGQDVDWRAGDTNTSMYGSVNMNVAANSFSYYNHRLGVGTSTPSGSAKLHIVGASDTLADYAIITTNNSATAGLWNVRNDGYLFSTNSHGPGTSSFQLYNTGTGVGFDFKGYYGRLSLGVTNTVVNATLSLTDYGTVQNFINFDADGAKGAIFGLGGGITFFGKHNTAGRFIISSDDGWLGNNGYRTWFKGNTIIAANPFSTSAQLQIQGTTSDNTLSALLVDNSGSTTGTLLKVRNDGVVAMSLLPTSNAGLSTGELYVDTAANILANGDKVVGWKV